MNVDRLQRLCHGPWIGRWKGISIQKGIVSVTLHFGDFNVPTRGGGIMIMAWHGMACDIIQMASDYIRHDRCINILIIIYDMIHDMTRITIITL